MTSNLLCADLVDGKDWNDMPLDWKPDTEKLMWDYQTDALQAAIKLLYHYYGETIPYDPRKTHDDKKRKESLFKDLKGFNPDIANIKVVEKDPSLLDDMRKHFTELTEDGETFFPFSNFVNKMGFWMATGSGKTHVMIKLVQILNELSKKKLIPNNKILILTETEDLRDQIYETIEHFNKNSQQKIRYLNLKDHFSTAHTIRPGPNEIIVYTYLSGNIKSETKQIELAYDDIDFDGEWYVLLDEAHKGSGINEEQRRMKYFSIISRNGYMFNFSATFTKQQPEDIRTTVFNFNLSKFLQAGFGKNVYLAQQEARAFRRPNKPKKKEKKAKKKKVPDFSSAAKRKIVLQSLIYLVLLKKIKGNIDTKTLPHLQTYHDPLLVAFTGSVNTVGSDLEMFFKELRKISFGLEKKEIENAGKDIIQNFTENTKYVFGNDDIYFAESVKNIIERLKPTDIYRNVFNSSNKGEFEWSTIPEHPDELVFQHKNASEPFAVIHIGEDGVQDWQEKLAKWQLHAGEKLESKSWFKETSEGKNKVNIIMGSRKFHEGWDTNRPNVMIFVNIGVGKSADKYVIQAIGRGVRIQPIANKRKHRKRIVPLKTVEKILDAEEIIDKYHVDPEEYTFLETLFLLGTKRETIANIIEQIKIEEDKEGKTIQLQENPRVNNLQLFIPRYQDTTKIAVKNLPKFRGNQQKLEEFLSWMGNTPVFARFADEDGFNPEALDRIRDYVANGQFDTIDDAPIDDQIIRLIKHVQVKPQKFARFENLDAKINHFKKIKITESDVKTQEIEELIKSVKEYTTDAEDNLISQLQQKIISSAEYKKRHKSLPKDNEKFETITMRSLDSHYFIPIIYGDGNNQTIIKPIIDVESEIDLINNLLEPGPKKKLAEFDWWMFSRIEAKKDDVFIPYYHHASNKIRNFYPDFIFWLQKGTKYFILFIDPKGIQNTDYLYKVDDFQKIFSKSQKHDGLDIEVKLFLYTDDKNSLPQSVQQYWYDDIEKCLAECT